MEDVMKHEVTFEDQGVHVEIGVEFHSYCRNKRDIEMSGEV